jgi:hypothetical protein
VAVEPELGGDRPADERGPVDLWGQRQGVEDARDGEPAPRDEDGLAGVVDTKPLRGH